MCNSRDGGQTIRGTEEQLLTPANVRANMRKKMASGLRATAKRDSAETTQPDAFITTQSELHG